MNGNLIDPPRNWPEAKRRKARYQFDISTCDQCGRIIGVGEWAFDRNGGGGDSAKVVCEKCFDRFVRA